MKIVKAAATVLLSPLGSTDTSLTLREFVDHKGNALALADFGENGYFVLIVRQGVTVEMIKCDGLTQNADDSATIDIATSGRHLNATSPYAGSSTGEDFTSGAEVIVTNDPLTMSTFANKDEENTFTVVPKIAAAPVDDTDAANKEYVDDVSTGTPVSKNRTVIAGNAGATVAAGNLVYLDPTDQEWKLCDADTAGTVENVLLGIAQGAGVDGGAISGGVLVDGLDSNQSGLTPGKVFASNTAGGLSSSAGTKEVTVGIAKSATEVVFKPRYDQQLTEDQQDAFEALQPTGVITMYGAASAPTGWLLCDGSAVSRATYATLFGIIGTTYGIGDNSTTFNVPNMKSSFPIGVGQKTRTMVFNGASAVDPSTDEITVTSNDWLRTGTAVALTGAALPTGLSAQTYYVIRVSATVIKLATSASDAITGTDVDITVDGSGDCTLTQVLTDRVLGAAGGEEAHIQTVDEMVAHSHQVYAGDNTGSPQKNLSTVEEGNSPGLNGTIRPAGGSGTSINSAGGDTSFPVMPPYVVVNFIIKT